MDSTRARAAPKYRRKPTGSYRLLQRDQRENAHTLRQLGTAYIEPKMNELVGQDDASPLTISDRLADLLERVRQREFGCIGGCKCKLSGCCTIASSRRRHQDHPKCCCRWQTDAAASRLPVAKECLSPVCSRWVLETTNAELVSTAASVRTDRKRLSIMSNANFTSLSSYQRDHMLACASTLNSAFSKSQHALVSHRAG